MVEPRWGGPKPLPRTGGAPTRTGLILARGAAGRRVQEAHDGVQRRLALGRLEEELRVRLAVEDQELFRALRLLVLLTNRWQARPTGIGVVASDDEQRGRLQTLRVRDRHVREQDDAVDLAGRGLDGRLCRGATAEAAADERNG